MIDEKALMRAVNRAMESAGTLPAKEAVKLVPADWHRICDLVLNPAPASAKLKEATLSERETVRLGSRLTVEGVDAVVVPVEPSREMRVSGRDKLRSLFVEMACEADAEDAYRAMLSAAGDER